MKELRLKISRPNIELTPWGMIIINQMASLILDYRAYSFYDTRITLKLDGI